MHMILLMCHHHAAQAVGNEVSDMGASHAVQQDWRRRPFNFTGHVNNL